MDRDAGTDEIQQYLHDHIPMSLAMGTRVLEAAPDRVVLEAPLEPNINHRETVFGGSISTLAILAAWTLVQLRLSGDVAPTRLVIQENSLRYLKPAEGTFSAVAHPPDSTDWERCRKMLERKGRGRVRICCDVLCDGERVAEFEGVYVGLRY
ncbi:Putative thioesterase (yiiD_Cterm) [Maioricimonas rarisocia]|uniref:Thioesterase (YiiD_Cterm) n=1 Tax=Maioricimonas rarisocia TaxID=2528026 RepID=A0A517Z552_9PLAN|nr:YiiD C-terminal domain-containing protein [Maioricimonas rarisocia]QDU37606.1 Putative thioesterase (yiiD_Cterm) [Maioricimonas rarisocia]